MRRVCRVILYSFAYLFCLLSGTIATLNYPLFIVIAFGRGGGWEEANEMWEEMVFVAVNMIEEDE